MLNMSQQTFRFIIIDSQIYSAMIFVVQTYFFAQVSMMYKHLVVFCFLHHYLITNVASDRFMLRDKVKLRCTRRFTPGVCTEPVSPVWTFDFFKQNCSERLGCIISTRSNRFKSFDMCITNCKTFIELYTLKLSENDDQSKRLRFYLDNSGRRVEDSILDTDLGDEGENSQMAEQEQWESPALVAFDKDDELEIGEFMPPDIDYAGVKFNNEDCDFMHHMRAAKGIN